jgi:hypothetical protein
MKEIIGVFGLLLCIGCGGSRSIPSEQDARLQLERDLDALCNDRGLCLQIAAVRKVTGFERADGTTLYYQLEYEAEAITANKIRWTDGSRASNGAAILSICTRRVVGGMNIVGLIGQLSARNRSERHSNESDG